MPAFTTAHIGPSPTLAVDHAGSGPLVVFLHGIGGNKRNWHDNLPAFATRFHAAAWDARGYGESEDYDGPLAFTDFRDDLLRVLDHFGSQKAHIVGLSMGGRIAAQFNTAFPERVASLVLCDTHLGFQHFSENARARFVALRKEPLLAGKEPKDIAAEVTKTLVGNQTDAVSIDKFIDSMSRLRKESYIKAIEASVEQDLDEHVDAINVPTLVVVGAHDKLTPPKIAHQIAARIDGARLEIIEDAGHLPNIERADVFNTVVMGFLQEVAAC